MSIIINDLPLQNSENFNHHLKKEKEKQQM